MVSSEILVDEQDVDLLHAHAWCLQRGGKTRYAASNFAGKKIYLHRLIFERMSGVPLGRKEVDHCNRNGLDNRRENLRVATRSEQLRNTSLNIRNKSGFRGVCAVGKRWRAYVHTDYRRVHLGYFDTAEEAAEAHRVAAQRLSPEFAN